MQLLIVKYLKGAISGLEEKQLYEWLLKDKKNIALFKREIFVYGLQHITDGIFDSKKAFNDFKGAISESKVEPTNHHQFKKHYKYAAVVIALISSVFIGQIVFKDVDDATNNNIKSVERNITQDDRVVLTLEDGTTKIFGDEKKELSYLTTKITTALEYNEIKVPKGQIFKITLSDSTVVWLNADTRLRFPKKFSKNLDTRTVMLKGEAFFDVAHNKEQPFIVNASTVSVKVLGTKFNVSSYPNDESIKTTLVQGSVSVTDSISPNKGISIKPSFQVSFDRNSALLSSKRVNTGNYTAWMQKKIVFEDMPFKDLLAKIERAYNIEIENQNNSLNNQLFTGQFDVEDVNVIFRALSTSVYFKYEITDKITIKNANHKD